MSNYLEKYNDFFIKEVDEIVPKDLLSQIIEIQQSRSVFQLKNFVINKQQTEEMKYFQTLIELQNIYFTLKRVYLEMEKNKVEISRLSNSEDEIDKINADLKRVDLEETMILTVGAHRELNALLDILNSFEKKYSRKDIEDNQESYWQQRLISQAEIDVISAQQGISFGNVEAMIEANMLKKEISN